MAEERHFVAFLNLEIDILEKDFTVDRSRQTVYFEDFVARFALWGEDYARIAAR